VDSGGEMRRDIVFVLPIALLAFAAVEFSEVVSPLDGLLQIRYSSSLNQGHFGALCTLTRASKCLIDQDGSF
jgi:hypothetical protein